MTYCHSKSGGAKASLLSGDVGFFGERTAFGQQLIVIIGRKVMCAMRASPETERQRHQKWESGRWLTFAWAIASVNGACDERGYEFVTNGAMYVDWFGRISQGLVVGSRNQ